MIRYLRIYKSFIAMGVKRMLAYRFDTWIGALITTSIWSFLTIFSMYALTLRTKGLFGWSAEELIMLSCIYNVFIGIISFMFARNFEEFSDLVNTGKLDTMFAKPVDSQFIVSLNKVHAHALIRTTIGAAVAAVYIYSLDLSVTSASLFTFVVLLAFGILLMYSVLFAINTLNIWFTRLDNINQLFYTLRSLGRYPKGAFAQAGEVVLVLASPFLIPLATPARALIGKATPYEIAELIIGAVIMFAISRMFWKFALKSYTSASG